MTKRSFITAIPLLSSLGAMGAADPIVALQDHPYLSPENCSLADPGTRWNEMDDALRGKFGGHSEQAQTSFYVAYAANLPKWMDARLPQAKASRPHLETAFTKAMEFIVLTVWGGRIHVLPRFSGTLQWIIWHGWQGSRQAFDMVDAYTRYEIDDLRALFEILFKANAEVWKKLAEERHTMDESLAALQKAELLLPEAGRSYFRAQLAKEIASAIISS